jgi:threonine dehydratase
MSARPWHLSPPDFAEITEAADRIKGALVETPLLESQRVNEKLGGRLLIKPEGLQRTGSFKVRGAWNRLAQLTAEERARGVVAFSSGNHGQAVAWAGRQQGVGTVVVIMPKDAPAAKIARTRGWGAEVILYDRQTEDREAIGRRLSEERGLSLVPPYEDRRIIAGQGTAALEIVRQAAELDARPDALLLGGSGGGLAAGCALVWEKLVPQGKVWLVEPEGFDDHRRSLASGTRESNPGGQSSICDSLLSPTPGELTFAINRPRLGGALAVSDAEAGAAMRCAFEEYGVVVEPGGSLGLAAVITGKFPLEGRTVAVLLSGANVDTPLFARILAQD